MEARIKVSIRAEQQRIQVEPRAIKDGRDDLVDAKFWQVDGLTPATTDAIHSTSSTLYALCVYSCEYECYNLYVTLVSHMQSLVVASNCSIE